MMLLMTLYHDPVSPRGCVKKIRTNLPNPVLKLPSRSALVQQAHIKIGSRGPDATGCHTSLSWPEARVE